uniref:Small ribosomal subunit protein uS2c n=2 Tax=Euglena gracilis TaxID=3039 RepID=RR2_EUGGR|nr:ribosomal protein S2 [Euglena gracilis]P30389.1 RecName: Full=Small ribosomal subunit protein uS2c; AltName: Full=30S ribosomal protein S2, chloroplastic [Euglena gracilis]AKL82378.1 ribosomal protein S2 [Euglena gracilis var. bacillaris]CAA50111.1 30S ribosomal protein S2 [Euglena gracilis]CAA77928.1 ribosomal protein S2 [Euglena gracilis]
MITVEKMLNSSVHLGHKVKQWNPRMRIYIYGERKGLHIIDLLQTIVCLKKACNFLIRSVRKGKRALFVCTKRFFSILTQKIALKCNSFFVTKRWLGGILTNWITIKNCINKLKQLSKQKEKHHNLLTKKERLVLKKKKLKLKKYFSGMRDMTERPEIVIIIGQNKEINAVRECKKLGIASITILDTNCDPTLTKYPIPSNDDSILSVSLILSVLCNSINRGVNNKVRQKFDKYKKFKKLS